MFKREIETELKDLANGYPIVTVIGPRQSGKTTLVQHAFPEKLYVNLEFPDIRAMALTDPRRFLEQFPNGAILDEIQRAPELLSYIQPLVDEKDQKGMFILTGSHQLELQGAISQYLASHPRAHDRRESHANVFALPGSPKQPAGCLRRCF